ncbi:Hypothetical predicted protein [Lecanosticta acicola]|uniref:Uncharacterized protein n=1 Tax=Lecanosticta acicola TaxID=111012 RepID=A0AAI8Z0C1_9PEZI|nr:Hypothetical predicted protein [Lecanosticta acicola]
MATTPQLTPEEKEALAERQRRTAEALIGAYKVWCIEDAMSLDNIFRRRTPDCIQRTIPITAGLPDRNNAQYRAYLQELVLLDLAPWEGEINIEPPIISDAESHVCVVRVHGWAKTGGGEIHDRTVWFLHCTADGEMVWRVDVWVDTRQSFAFQQKHREWQEYQKKKDSRRKKRTGGEGAAASGGGGGGGGRDGGRKKSRSPRHGKSGSVSSSGSGSGSGRGSKRESPAPERTGSRERQG